MIKLKLYAILIGLLFSTILFAADTQILKVDANQPQFTVTLAANPTTGFQWRVLSYDKTKLCLIKSEYVASKPQRMGSGGNMKFTFKLMKRDHYPVSSRIRFQYARSWDLEQGKFKDVVVQVNKEPQKPLIQNRQ